MAPYSIIIPVYNGAAYIASTLQELGDFFATRPATQIIFVNDGSTDDTEKIVQRSIASMNLPITIISLSENKGKGYAVKEGFKNASPDSLYVAFTDIELPYGLLKIEEAVQIMEKNEKLQVVVGDRTKNTEGQYSLYRNFFKRCFRLFLPRAIRHIADTQSGMKVFRASAARTIFPRLLTDRWVMDVEMMLIAVRHTYGIYPLPVTIKPQCATGRGGVSVTKHTWQILKDLYRVKYYDKRHRYHP